MKLLDHFSELTIYPENAKKLRELVLQFAVTGKLTTKFRNENAYCSNSKRDQFDAEINISKKKETFPPISVDEYPYELPSGWDWFRIGELISIIGGSQPPKNKFINEKCEGYTRLVQIRDFKSDRFITYVPDEFATRPFSKDDIMIGRYGPPVFQILRGLSGTYNVALMKADPNPDYLNKDFLFLLLQEPRIQKIIIDDSERTAGQSGIRKPLLNNIVYGLPTKKEQKAIVAKVDVLMKEIDALEQLSINRIERKNKFVTSALHHISTTNLQELNGHWDLLKTHFHHTMDEVGNIKKLRETILQLAVQGKLTRSFRTRHPELASGSASATALLENIKAERARLIKDGKIKKEKPLPPIADDEIPYELPEGWVWCRLGEIATLITDGKHGNCRDQNSSGYYFLSAKDVQNGRLLYANARQINYDEFLEVHNRTNLKPGDLCIVNTGATVGKTAIALNDEKTAKTTFQKSVAVVKILHQFISVQFLENFIKFQTPRLLKKSGGSAINNLLIGDMKKLIFPLAPYEEQKAIVDKVNQLMSLCDQLEQHITDSQHHAEDLMKSLVREVVEV